MLGMHHRQYISFDAGLRNRQSSGQLQQLQMLLGRDIGGKQLLITFLGCTT